MRISEGILAGIAAILANKLRTTLTMLGIVIGVGAVLAMISIGLVMYFRNRGVCSLDDLQRNRRRVFNTSLAVFTASVATYLVCNFVVLEVIGLALGLPWEDSAFWNT